MASLKEIKSRIQSVKSTQKITSAMKMVSSAKLRKAQRIIENFYPYEQKMNALLNNFLSAQEGDIDSVFADEREIERVAIVVFASNSSLCGSFNNNVAKRLTQVLESYNILEQENILLYPIGKKIAKACVKMNFKPQGDFESLADKPNYNQAVNLADTLMNLFLNKEIDRVELIYHHFESKSSHIITSETFLPLRFESRGKGTPVPDYIVEPDSRAILEELIPKVLRIKLYTALLDSNASEHAARAIAMQTATDNADELLQELSLQYNKSRQQAITNELLDIVGGSFGRS
ncbi:MAG: F0F1 ATP synthase subunit gamma [Paludibacter sp.]